MHFHLAKNIFPSFHKNGKDEDDNASTMSKRTSRSSMTLVNPDSFPVRSPSPPHAEVPNDVPFGLSREDKAVVARAPGATDKTYPEDAVAASHLINRSEKKETDLGPHAVHTFVRVCPHENLSFERLQTILKLPGFKSSKEDINAIGAMDEIQQHSKSGARVCFPIDGFPQRPAGTFKLKYNSKHKRGWTGPVIGLELHATWTLDSYKPSTTRNDIQASLQKLENVPLCPHRTMNDPWILEMIYKIAHPHEEPSDPIDEWGKPPSSISDFAERSQDCDRCKTPITITVCKGGLDGPQVKVIRRLGPGSSENDPDWLAQCGV